MKLFILLCSAVVLPKNSEGTTKLDIEVSSRGKFLVPTFTLDGYLTPKPMCLIEGCQIDKMRFNTTIKGKGKTIKQCYRPKPRCYSGQKRRIRFDDISIRMIYSTRDSRLLGLRFFCLKPAQSLMVGSQRKNPNGTILQWKRETKREKSGQTIFYNSCNDLNKCGKGQRKKLPHSQTIICKDPPNNASNQNGSSSKSVKSKQTNQDQIGTSTKVNQTKQVDPTTSLAKYQSKQTGPVTDAFPKTTNASKTVGPPENSTVIKEVINQITNPFETYMQTISSMVMTNSQPSSRISSSISNNNLNHYTINYDNTKATREKTDQQIILISCLAVAGVIIITAVITSLLITMRKQSTRNREPSPPVSENARIENPSYYSMNEAEGDYNILHERVRNPNAENYYQTKEEILVAEPGAHNDCFVLSPDLLAESSTDEQTTTPSTDERTTTPNSNDIYAVVNKTRSDSIQVDMYENGLYESSGEREEVVNSRPEN